MTTHLHKSAAHPLTPDQLARRRWLRASGATLAGAMGLAALGLPMARAQSGYKALVCVFLYGGNDGMNMVLPRDSTRHAQYAAVRQNLALPLGSLVPLGSDYGLHPAMSALSAAWGAGDLAPVFNVGPLAQPLTKAQYLAASPEQLPESLFSHSDQQIQWEAAGTSSITRTGWGGRAAATLGTVNPVISFGGNGHFGLAEFNAPLVLPGPGSSFGLEGLEGDWAPNVARRNALAALYTQPFGANTLRGAFSASEVSAAEVSLRLGGLIGTSLTNASPALRNAFLPLADAQGNITTDFGRQLFQVAKMIEGRATVQGNTQLFFTQMGGFDTHSAQVSVNSQTGDHAGLMRQLADGMAAFHRAMIAIGMNDAVTLFTQSDFGRTFAPNASNGTDHAWGNHQLVMGGAVNGGFYGSYPELVLGGPSDVGQYEWELQGRWIPGLSVDQYAATLLRWVGASEPQLASVLPNLANFGSATDIGFL